MNFADQLPTEPEATQSVKLFQQLEGIVELLRSERGCPWDQQQTAAGLKKYLLEEAAELAEAIESGDSQQIAEEAGDLYFVLALLLRICAEQGRCSSADALSSICVKMRRRHPHVFAADGRPMPSDEQLREQWERIKAEEKSR
ncbi:MazG nucleotide pyrophosphohydrolase domain-containing protein [Candidatus Electronema sp. JM]|uniref:MazG nucleotide pyrophosphohydrolase domain-containing protein n=1 Tax=Candidatus Electronema sp. JM TaxID=3401571 RepID=UPI003AA84E7C